MARGSPDRIPVVHPDSRNRQRRDSFGGEIPKRQNQKEGVPVTTTASVSLAANKDTDQASARQARGLALIDGFRFTVLQAVEFSSDA